MPPFEIFQAYQFFVGTTGIRFSCWNVLTMQEKYETLADLEKFTEIIRNHVYGCQIGAVSVISPNKGNTQ
jgi:hypothetical protein